MRKLSTPPHRIEVVLDYTEPRMEILSVSIECGFAGSLTIEDSEVKDYEEDF